MIKNSFDKWSAIVIGLTFVLFVLALFVKGLTHDILLESAVFLVSVKLIMMSYHNRVYINRVNDRLEKIQRLIEDKKEKS